MYRKPKTWRHRDLQTLLHELDEVYMQEQVDDRSQTKAAKILRRGPQTAPPTEEVNPKLPPTGIPRCLIDKDFMDKHVSNATELSLKISGKFFDLTGMLAHLRWLQSKPVDMVP